MKIEVNGQEIDLDIDPNNLPNKVQLKTDKKGKVQDVALEARNDVWYKVNKEENTETKEVHFHVKVKNEDDRQERKLLDSKIVARTNQQDRLLPEKFQEKLADKTIRTLKRG